MGIILKNYKTITSLEITKLHLRDCYVFTKPFPFLLDPQEDDLPEPCLQLDWHCGLCSAQWNMGRDVGHGQALPWNLLYSSPSLLFHYLMILVVKWWKWQYKGERSRTVWSRAPSPALGTDVTATNPYYIMSPLLVTVVSFTQLRTLPCSHDKVYSAKPLMSCWHFNVSPTFKDSGLLLDFTSYNNYCYSLEENSFVIHEN